MLEGWDPSDIHRISRDQIEHILKCLRFIDRAKKLVAQMEGGNEIAEDMRASVDGIYNVVKNVVTERPRIG
jgi:archaellum component FlaC